MNGGEGHVGGGGAGDADKPSGSTRRSRGGRGGRGRGRGGSPAVSRDFHLTKSGEGVLGESHSVSESKGSGVVEGAGLLSASAAPFVPSSVITHTNLHGGRGRWRGGGGGASGTRQTQGKKTSLVDKPSEEVPFSVSVPPPLLPIAPTMMVSSPRESMSRALHSAASLPSGVKEGYEEGKKTNQSKKKKKGDVNSNRSGGGGGETEEVCLVRIEGSTSGKDKDDKTNVADAKEEDQESESDTLQDKLVRGRRTSMCTISVTACSHLLMSVIGLINNKLECIICLEGIRMKVPVWTCKTCWRYSYSFNRIEKHLSLFSATIALHLTILQLLIRIVHLDCVHRWRSSVQGPSTPRMSIASSSSREDTSYPDEEERRRRSRGLPPPSSSMHGNIEGLYSYTIVATLSDILTLLQSLYFTFYLRSTYYLEMSSL